jgi:lipopolysaccharide export LptBFGC system permease protein LptF
MEKTAQSLRGSEPKYAPAVSRTGIAAALTLFAVGLGVVLVALYGTGVIPFYLVSLPVPLVLLWLSADVARSDELPGGGGSGPDTTR